MDFPLIWAAITISTVINVIWCVFLVLIGVNMLIIVHEFGHFIVARLCGVRCDKFYIWFDIYGWKIFKFKWGDTEFGLGVLPLGGYVKMLGQEDSPGAIKAEIERARQAANQSRDGNGAVEPEKPLDNSRGSDSADHIAQLETALYAKDSYLAKNVPQRMAIIVAGVVMNIIFAFICGVGAYMIGVKEESPIIGNTAPGSNAWAAGLQPGDRVISIDGRPVRKFSDIRTSIIRTSNPEPNFVIERPGIAEPIELKIAPSRTGKALMATIGIVNDRSLTLAEPAVYPWIEKTDETNKLKPGDSFELKQFGDGTFTQFQNMQTKWRKEPLSYTFRRSGSDESTYVILPPIHTNTLGIVFKPGKIVKTQPHAAQFGFEGGDVLVSLDGEAIDPLKLSGQIYDISQAGGGTVTFVVERNGEQKTLEVDIPADQFDSHILPAEFAQYACSDILGVAFEVTNIVQSGNESIEPGSTLEEISFPVETLSFTPFGVNKSDNDRVVIRDTGVFSNYTLALHSYFLPRWKEGKELTLTLKSGEKTVTTTVKVAQDPDWFAVDRGLNFDAAKFIDKAESFGGAIAMGADVTLQNTLLVYHTIRQLMRNVTGTGNVSPKGLGGPITIVYLAYSIASMGMAQYLLFLCLLSANLAVLNILPIPVLDGGHVVFLTYEAIFRKPPNENVQIILSYIGLFLLLSLMVWVFWLDISRLIWGW